MPELLNLERLNECTGGDIAFGAELLEEFANLLCDEVAKLARSIDTGNLNEARFVAHAIKGASGSVGAEAISEVAARMEVISKEDDLSAAQATLIELERQASRFLNWYESPARAA